MKMNFLAHKYRNRWRFAGVLAMAALAAWGCAGAYPALHADNEVTRMFAANSVPETFRYYIDGRSGMPYAIIGIDPNYHLVPGSWEPVQPNTRDFARKVLFMWQPSVWYRQDPAQGAYIVSPDGQRIGIWYSQYPYTTIRLHAGNRVEIHSPHRPTRSED
jgi:hypothetical protein